MVVLLSGCGQAGCRREASLLHRSVVPGRRPPESDRRRRSKCGRRSSAPARATRLRRFLSIAHDGVVLRGEGVSTVLRLEDGAESPVMWSAIGVQVPDATSHDDRRPPRRWWSGRRSRCRATVPEQQCAAGSAAGRTSRSATWHHRLPERVPVDRVDTAGSRSSATTSAARWDGVALNRRRKPDRRQHHPTTRRRGSLTEHRRQRGEDNVVRQPDARALPVRLVPQHDRAQRFSGNVPRRLLTCAARPRARPPLEGQHERR